MKTRSLTWALLLLLTVGLPCAADDTPDADPVPDEDTILGTWYAQVMEGEVVPADKSFRLVFEDNGVAKGYMDDEEEVWGYTHDKANATIIISDKDDPTDVEVKLKYSFVDDMLVFRYKEDEDDEEEVMELTRNPEGTERHQKLREGEGEGDGDDDDDDDDDEDDDDDDDDDDDEDEDDDDDDDRRK